MAITISGEQKKILVGIYNETQRMVEDHERNINYINENEGHALDAREFQIRALKDLSDLAFMIQDLTTLTTAFMGGHLINLVRQSQARDFTKWTTELLGHGWATKMRGKRPRNPKAVKQIKLRRKLKHHSANKPKSRGDF